MYPWKFLFKFRYIFITKTTIITKNRSLYILRNFLFKLIPYVFIYPHFFISKTIITYIHIKQAINTHLYIFTHLYRNYIVNIKKNIGEKTRLVKL